MVWAKVNGIYMGNIWEIPGKYDELNGIKYLDYRCFLMDLYGDLYGVYMDLYVYII